MGWGQTQITARAWVTLHRMELSGLGAALCVASRGLQKNGFGGKGESWGTGRRVTMAVRKELVNEVSQPASPSACHGPSHSESRPAAQVKVKSQYSPHPR